MAGLVPVTAATAGYCAVLVSGLALRVGLNRFICRVTNKPLPKPEEFEKHIRAHANTAENVPLFLLLLATMELNGYASRRTLQFLGAGFALARTAHSLNLGYPNQVPFGARVLGFMSQMGIVLGTGGVLAYKSIKAMRK